MSGCFSQWNECWLKPLQRGGEYFKGHGGLPTKQWGGGMMDCLPSSGGPVLGGGILKAIASYSDCTNYILYALNYIFIFS